MERLRVPPQDGPVQNECRGALLEFLAPYCKATCNECCGDANLPYPLCETIVSLPYLEGNILVKLLVRPPKVPVDTQDTLGLCNVEYFDDAFSGRLCRKSCGFCT